MSQSIRPPPRSMQRARRVRSGRHTGRSACIWTCPGDRNGDDGTPLNFVKPAHCRYSIFGLKNPTTLQVEFPFARAPSFGATAAVHGFNRLRERRAPAHTLNDFTIMVPKVVGAVAGDLAGKPTRELGGTSNRREMTNLRPIISRWLASAAAWPTRWHPTTPRSRWRTNQAGQTDDHLKDRRIQRTSRLLKAPESAGDQWPPRIPRSRWRTTTQHKPCKTISDHLGPQQMLTAGAAEPRGRVIFSNSQTCKGMGGFA